MKWILVFLFSTVITTNAVADQAKPVDSKEEIMRVLDVYMETFNRMDMEAWEDTMHFPHYRLASGEMKVQQGTGELSVESLKQLLGSDWHHSKWQKRSIIHMSETKAHVDTIFTRFRRDGSVITSFDSLYVLTREEGRWGVKMRSSMAP